MTEPAAEQMLPQCFYRHVAERPDATYLTQPLGGGRVDDYSFARVMDEAKRIAAHIRSFDLPKGSKIAMLSKNCAHFFITDLAIWMSGHVSVALYPTLTPDIVQYILEHSEAKLLFLGKLDAPNWADMRTGIPDEIPLVTFPFPLDDPPARAKAWNDILREQEPISDTPHRDPDDESIIIYTSGSTGTPKGVLHSFRTLSLPTHELTKTIGATPSDRMLSYLPLAHAMDRWLSECMSMYVGMHVFFAESVDTFVEDLKRAHPTLFISVPRLWLKFQLGVFAKMPEKKLERMLRIPVLSGIVKRKVLAGLGLDAVRFAGSGSAPIPEELITWYRNLGLELLEGYGMSENFNYSHLTMPGRGRPGYIGHAHPGVECRLDDSGEILVKSPGNMLGYYKQPELTAEAFTEDGFLRTGDQGVVDDDGRLKITGRIKELFKTSKGKYVAPVPIENMLNAHHRLELSCVGGSSMPATHAVVQLADDLRPKLGDAAFRAELTKELEKLLAQVNAQIPGYEQLAFLAVAKDPWTTEGGQLTPP
ncbi:MAG TPA: AMP-binding protein [Polyangiaceae bacterium LLY-WYZ-14_1]|nr:AMP-binding protein [Polyangiaceae bacterium LLY-WYZ-14_1]